MNSTQSHTQTIKSFGWLGEITYTQILDLESIFSTLTENGWIIPDWIQALKTAVTHRDYYNVTL